MFCQQKSVIPSKITKLIMEIPQTRIEKAPSPLPPPPKEKKKKTSNQNKILTAMVSDSMIKDVYVYICLGII